MKLTVLRAEHDAILTALDLVEDRLAKCTDDVNFDRIVNDFLLFATLYIDENHHGKEEGSLFPKLLSNAFLHDIPNVLSEEHIHGRHLARKIKEALGNRILQAEEIANYVDFMRDHIRLENEMVFEAIEAGLDEATAADLDDEFKGIENDVIRLAGADVWNRVIQHPFVEIEK